MPIPTDADYEPNQCGRGDIAMSKGNHPSQAKAGVGDMSFAEIKDGLYKHFGVTNDKDLLKARLFKMATDGQKLTRKDLQNPERMAELYRRYVGSIRNDPLNRAGQRGVINGTNIFSESRPWQVFGINPQDAKYQVPTGLKGTARKQAAQEADSRLRADVKTSYRRLSKQHHPDYGGDRDVFERLNQFYESLTTRF